MAGLRVTGALEGYPMYQVFSLTNLLRLSKYYYLTLPSCVNAFSVNSKEADNLTHWVNTFCYANDLSNDQG